MPAGVVRDARFFLASAAELIGRQHAGQELRRAYDENA